MTAVLLPRVARLASRGAGAAGLLATTLLLPGCYRYTAVPVTDIRPNEEVLVQVSPDAAVRVGPYLGVIRDNLEGQVTPTETDSLMVAIWVGKDYRGTAFENARQFVAFAPREILQVRRREISPAKTALLAIGALAVTGIIIDRVGFLENPNPGGNGRPYSPPPEESIAIRIPLRW